MKTNTDEHAYALERHYAQQGWLAINKAIGLAVTVTIEDRLRGAMAEAITHIDRKNTELARRVLSRALEQTKSL